MSELLDIGEVLKRSGLAASTLHLWERRGLIQPAGRMGLRRQFNPAVMDRIAIIVVCQRAGFTLSQIEQLLAPEAFAEGKTKLQSKLDELRERQAQLAAAIDGLEHAMACPAPSPFECAEFLSSLSDVLPVATAPKPS